MSVPGADNDWSSNDGVPPITNCRILVVDDDRLIQKLVRTRLEMEGIEHIEVAENGRDGLLKIDSFRPDLVILDVDMPVMDGIEFLRLVRAKPKYADLDVIVSTAIDDTDKRDDLLELGASNVIVKPINHDLLAARVRIHLEHGLMVKSLKTYRQRVAKELASAQKMQLQLLPADARVEEIRSRYGLIVNRHFQPSSELGGDYFDLWPMDEHRFGVLMIDFSGHGISAAINTFRLSTILRGVGSANRTPGEFLSEINKGLAEILSVSEFATALFAIVDVDAGVISYSAAGAPHPIVGRGSPPQLALGDGSGLPLSIDSGTVYENRELEFPKGSFLVLTSDAVTESRDAEGQLLGIEGLCDLIGHVTVDPGNTASLEELLDRFFAHIPVPADDDRTLLWIGR